MISHKRFSRMVEDCASAAMTAAGNTYTLVIAFLFILGWSIAGFYLNFSVHWQMIMETLSAAITFIMVFLIQKSQNKHSLSIQLKLNELVAANALASNRLVDVEGMTEDELKVIKKYYSKLSEFAKGEENLHQPHSIDELHREHAIKKEMEQELLDNEKKTKPAK